MEQAAFDKIFNLPFSEAVNFFRDKLNIPTLAWNELDGAAHAKAFTSAGAYEADLLNELRQMTDKAIAGGMDIREFRKQFKPLVERYGWQLKGGGAAWRSDLIWRTNISTAYQAGRWQQFEDAGIKYLMYMHNDSVRYPRPTHKAMDGLILPIADPFWTKNYPPNGWGCKCRAVAATEKEYKAAPKELTKRPKDWPYMADAGWDYNVGQAGQERNTEFLKEKLASLPKDIAGALKALITGRGAQWK
jgi:SPP1 gp7 family putative phage head morphogenesis protein